MSDDNGQFKVGNQARRTHGLESAFATSHDEAALTEPQHSRLVELRAELQTADGVLGVAVRQAADAELIREWGAAWIREHAKTMGPSVFQHAMFKRYFTAAESSRRALLAVSSLLAKGDGGLTAADVLESIRHDKD